MSWHPIHSNLGEDAAPQTWLSEQHPGVKIEHAHQMDRYYVTAAHIPGWWTAAATLTDAQRVVGQYL